MALNEQDLLEVLKQQFLRDPEDQMPAFEAEATRYLEAPRETVAYLMRIAHNLKGAAQLAGFSEFAVSLHDAESVFQEMAKHKISDDGVQACALLIKRLGVLLHTQYRCLVEGQHEEDRDVASWQSTISGLKHAVQSAPILDAEAVVSQSEVPANTPSGGADDWGFSSLETSSGGAHMAAPEPMQVSKPMFADTPAMEATAHPMFANEPVEEFEDNPMFVDKNSPSGEGSGRAGGAESCSARCDRG